MYVCCICTKVCLLYVSSQPPTGMGQCELSRIQLSRVAIRFGGRRPGSAGWHYGRSPRSRRPGERLWQRPHRKRTEADHRGRYGPVVPGIWVARVRVAGRSWVVDPVGNLAGVEVPAGADPGTLPDGYDVQPPALGAPGAHRWVRSPGCGRVLGNLGYRPNQRWPQPPNRILRSRTTMHSSVISEYISGGFIFRSMEVYYVGR